jgi:hypothetical protein
MEQKNYDWKKNFLFGGLAAGTGIFGYLIGRSKSFRGVSITLMAIATMLYLPKGCDTLDKYIQNENQIKFYKLKQEYKKDSLDTVLQYELIKKDSIYTKLNDILERTDKKYNSMIEKHTYNTKKALRDLENKRVEAEKSYEDLYSSIQRAEKKIIDVIEKNGWAKKN